MDNSPQVDSPEKDLVLKHFEHVVRDTINSIPPEYFSKIENLAIMVSQWPTRDELDRAHVNPGGLLFGLYTGIPRVKRGSNYQALPDKIMIYAGPILAISRNWDEVKNQIRSTILHEIGHYFGLSEDEIRNAEKERRENNYGR